MAQRQGWAPPSGCDRMEKVKFCFHGQLCPDIANLLLPGADPEGGGNPHIPYTIGDVVFRFLAIGFNRFPVEWRLVSSPPPTFRQKLNIFFSGPGMPRVG